MDISRTVCGASSSSSFSASSTKHWIYDVFLSFRGQDTRNNFTGHLYMALEAAGISAFIDDNELRRGENISVELVRAIQGSRISVIVFSRRYVDSSWCLEELVKIMECRSTLGQLVFPVFFDVDPSDVRNQSGTFAEALNRKHKYRDKDKVQRWRAALTQAANLSGWDLRNTDDGHEGKFIRTILDEITELLNRTDLHVADHQVGVDPRVKELSSYLGVEILHDNRIVGIWGMGGMGKTTVAKALFNRFRHSFEASCFLANIRETANQHNGIVTLQERLLSDITKSTSRTQVGNVDTGINVIKKRLGSRRVLVIVDDVDHVDQLNALSINRHSFGPGSRIVIITRDKHVLEQVDASMRIYEACQLKEEEALELFSWHAFKSPYPHEEFLGHSKNIVRYCGGLPLALKVLGCHLFNRKVTFWESAVKKLEIIPPHEILEKLKISFDGLNDDTEKEIFLDISCFFIGMDMNFVKQILDGCGFFPDSGIEVLIQRCLLTVNEENELMIHDLLRDMGREIARGKSSEKSSPHPGKWSRIWRSEEATEVLRENSGSEEIQGLAMKIPTADKKASFDTKTFAKMKRLRLLQLNNVQLTGSYKYLSNRLRWLCWHRCHLKIIPKDFNLQQLVAIDLQYSKLRNIWEDPGLLKKLKILNLSHSRYLSKSPDFSTLPKLESLILEGCKRLVEVHQSIGHLDRLSLVNLRGCRMLKELPRSFYKLKSVETLVLDDCSRFEKLDEDLGDMVSLTTLLAGKTAIRSIPPSIVKLKKLGCISLHHLKPGFTNLILPPSLGGLNSLTKLSLRGCNLIGDAIPKDLGSLYSLTDLDLGHNRFNSLPSLGGLLKLDRLRLDNCRLTDDAIPSDLGSLVSLQKLDLGWNRFCTLPSLSGLSKLQHFFVNDCENLQAIPDLPTSLTNLNADHCQALVRMPNFSNMSNMTFLNLRHSAKLIEVPGLDGSLNSLRYLRMEGCTNIRPTFKKSILQAWTSAGHGGIFLPGKCFPKWFKNVSKGAAVCFKVPSGGKLIALTVCIAYSSNLDDCISTEPSAIHVTDHRNRRTYLIEPMHAYGINPHLDYLWQGHLSNKMFNLYSGDVVEVFVILGPHSDFKVKKIGVNLVWEDDGNQLLWQGRLLTCKRIGFCTSIADYYKYHWEDLPLICRDDNEAGPSLDSTNVDQPPERLRYDPFVIRLSCDPKYDEAGPCHDSPNEDRPAKRLRYDPIVIELSGDAEDDEAGPCHDLSNEDRPAKRLRYDPIVIELSSDDDNGADDDDVDDHDDHETGPSHDL